MQKIDMDENVFAMLRSELTRSIRLSEALQDEIDKLLKANQEQGNRRSALQNDLLVYKKRIRTLEYLIS